MNGRIQNAKVSLGAITIGILLVTQVVVFAFGYGALIQKVTFNRELISGYQENQYQLLQKMDELNTRLMKLEVLFHQGTSGG